MKKLTRNLVKKNSNNINKKHIITEQMILRVGLLLMLHQ